MPGVKKGLAVDRRGTSGNGSVQMWATQSQTSLCGEVVMWNVKFQTGYVIYHHGNAKLHTGKAQIECSGDLIHVQSQLICDFENKRV